MALRLSGVIVAATFQIGGGKLSREKSLQKKVNVVVASVNDRIDRITTGNLAHHLNNIKALLNTLKEQPSIAQDLEKGDRVFAGGQSGTIVGRFETGYKVHIDAERCIMGFGFDEVCQ